MIYYVRTTKDRVLDESYNALSYIELIDYNHKPIDSFIEQLKIISSDNSVLLEDDLVLCKDFKNIIEDIINKYPNYIINFFTKPIKYFTTNINDTFSCNQCTYYPKGISKIIAEEMENVRKQFPGIKQYDTIEDMAMRRLGIIHVDYRPCIVQHINKKSLIQDSTLKNMQTYYFIDYLDELGMKYEDAYKNKSRLEELLKEKISSDVGTRKKKVEI